MDDWAKIEELTRLMALALLQRGTPQEACAYTPAVDQAADAWLQRWNDQDPALRLPADPLLCRVLLARFRHATAFATQCRLAGKPMPKFSADVIVESLLIDLWYAQFRPRWLSGERGVTPSEN